MMYQLPAGGRDLLPLDVAQKRWIEDRVQEVFQSWSYHRIITPTLERLETLTAGGAVQPESVIQVWDAGEGILGLRPELTASIARAAVTRMTGVTYPQRLYYIANIFRRQPSTQATGQHELFQAGIELIGSSGLRANAEVLLLLADCLAQVRLEHWHLVLGDAMLTRSLLAVFPDSIRPKVRHAIATLDEITLQNLPLEPALKEQALNLLALRGSPQAVFENLEQWPLDTSQLEIVQNLKDLIQLIDPQTRITLDLSLVQTFDYYTGIVFDVVSDRDSGQRVLAQGGRYDELLGLYHPEGKALPGIGFSMNIQDIHQVLLSKDTLPQETLRSQYLVVPESGEAQAAAFAYAQALRAKKDRQRQRVELELDVHTKDETQAYAQRRGISQIAWVNDQGSVTIETLD